MKICLDAGHFGKYNRSPVNSAYYESDMTWKLHLYLAEALRRHGFEVVTTRPVQAHDLSLTARGKAAAGCALFLSLHSNASADHEQDFPLACCCVAGSADRLGQELADTVHAVMQTRQAGRIWKRSGSGGLDYYGVLRSAAAVGVPGILLEHSFHTEANATAWLLQEENLRRLAEAEAGTIARYYGLAETGPEAAPAPEAFVPYRVKVLDDALNIRKTPAWTEQDIVGCIRDHGVYTIVEERMLGTTRFGRLRSGAGWISLGGAFVKRV